MENASGNWVQPYATNIAAALQSATLNADLSQNLDGVYTSSNPLTYPISAYSYIVTQCAITSSWKTCQGPLLQCRYVADAGRFHELCRLRRAGRHGESGLFAAAAGAVPRHDGRGGPAHRDVQPRAAEPVQLLRPDSDGHSRA